MKCEDSRYDGTYPVIGLGYVGLPVVTAFARKFPCVIGFDIDRAKVDTLNEGRDPTNQVECLDQLLSHIHFTSDPKDLSDCTFFIVAVPTPVGTGNRPDLTPLLKASETIGNALQSGAVVVFESTVYPGVTEDICGPALAKASGLRRGNRFKLGYSPERISPGEPNGRLETITKIISAEDDATLDRVEAVYKQVVEAGLHRAPSIRVAEAAKVVENTQRDINIALMNEVALICDRMGIRTMDVLAAARTKWNFLPFNPGLVGGHCIAVDPYYLTSVAEEQGYRPEVILAGRRLNDSMGRKLGEKMVKLLVQSDLGYIKNARIGVLGIAYKENVPDLRNSRVPEIVAELRECGFEPLVHDPMVDPGEVELHHQITFRHSTGFTIWTG